MPEVAHRQKPRPLLQQQGRYCLAFDGVELMLSCQYFFVASAILGIAVPMLPDFLLMQTDVVLRVTNTSICGSDLHLYLRSMPGMKSGDVLGHEVRLVMLRVESLQTRMS